MNRGRSKALRLFMGGARCFICRGGRIQFLGRMPLLVQLVAGGGCLAAVGRGLLLQTGALKAGVSPKVISERIGHANVGFFLQTYAHVLGGDDRDAAEQAAAFLIGAPLGCQQRRNGMISVTNVPKSVPKRHENGPRKDLRGPFCLVALSQFWSNTLFTDVQDDASVTDGRMGVRSMSMRPRQAGHK
jgi:hypothetical protein